MRGRLQAQARARAGGPVSVPVPVPVRRGRLDAVLGRLRVRDLARGVLLEHDRRVALDGDDDLARGSRLRRRPLARGLVLNVRHGQMRGVVSALSERERWRHVRFGGTSCAKTGRAGSCVRTSLRSSGGPRGRSAWRGGRCYTLWRAMRRTVDMRKGRSLERQMLPYRND